MSNQACSKQMLLVVLSDDITVLSEEDLTHPLQPDAPRFLLALQTVFSAVKATQSPVSLAVGAEAAYHALNGRLPETASAHASFGAGLPLYVLFAISLPEDGISYEYTRFLSMLRTDRELLANTTGAVLVDGKGALYTKSTAAQFVFAANSAGCAFIGRPLVEATGDLSNFRIIAGNLGTDLAGAYFESVRDLTDRLLDSHSVPEKNGAAPPRLLALHASSRETSNTLALWHAVRDRLTDIDTQEISLRNGTLTDCVGCPFELCLHYGEQDSCFYGGVMTEEVYPALRTADALLMVCPNYNDALGANLTAFINRLTAMYRAHPFSDKALFAIVVSGYSGSDMPAAQLIAALNMNKSFYLPPRFALLATANAPGEAMRIAGIGTTLDRFAENIRQALTGHTAP